MIFLFILLTYLHIGLAVCPNGLLATNATAGEDALIVRIHNDLRNKVERGKLEGQPKAEKMKRLVWDFKLAEEAAKVANTCEFAHIIIEDARFSVGQNLYMESSNSPIKKNNWEKGINSWFDEHKLYKYPEISMNTLHYTQIVWANTKFIGCAVSHYKKNNKYHKLYVCNYGPGGNVIGEPPYKAVKTK